MSDFVEAIVTLIPSEAGGRSSAIFPRDGSYRPILQTSGGDLVRIRIIEGPPSIQPGHEARIVAEVETAAALVPGTEFDLIEQERCVGILSVTRVCRAMTA